MSPCPRPPCVVLVLTASLLLSCKPGAAGHTGALDPNDPIALDGEIIFGGISDDSADSNGTDGRGASTGTNTSSSEPRSESGTSTGDPNGELGADVAGGSNVTLGAPDTDGLGAGTGTNTSSSEPQSASGTSNGDPGGDLGTGPAGGASLTLGAPETDGLDASSGTNTSSSEPLSESGTSDGDQDGELGTGPAGGSNLTLGAPSESETPGGVQTLLHDAVPVGGPGINPPGDPSSIDGSDLNRPWPPEAGAPTEAPESSAGTAVRPGGAGEGDPEQEAKSDGLLAHHTTLDWSKNELGGLILELQTGIRKRQRESDAISAEITRVTQLQEPLRERLQAKSSEISVLGSIVEERKAKLAALEDNMAEVSRGLEDTLAIASRALVDLNSRSG